MTFEERLSQRVECCPQFKEAVYDCHEHGLLLSIPWYAKLQGRAKIVFSKANEYAPYILLGSSRFPITEEGQLLKYECGYPAIMGRFAQMKGLHKIKLHRLVYIAAYGKIEPGYHVHHIDGDKFNIAVSNLVALAEKEHSAVHKRDVSIPKPAIATASAAEIISQEQNSLIAKSQGKCTVCFACGKLYYLLQGEEPKLEKAKYCPNCGCRLS